MSVEAMKQHGLFSWNELMTSDLAAAKSFYSELLGWTLVDIKAGDMEYTMIKVGEQQIGGMMAKPPMAGHLPVAWTGYVTVDDVDARAERAKTLGGEICVPPMDIPEVGRFAIIADQQGAQLAMITYLKS